MLQAVIMDFNGVIIDDEPVHMLMFQKVLGEEGVVLTEHDYHEQYLGYDDRGCLSAALQAAGRPTTEAAIARLVQRKSEYYNAYIGDHMRIFPGVVEFIGCVASAYPMAVCSGALRNEIDYVLGRVGLRGCFQAIIAAEDTTRWKPDPQGYRLACDALRHAGNESLCERDCLVVEDSLAGIEAARLAGMRCVAVTNSYAASELEAADLVVPCLDGLGLDALRSVFG